MKILVIGGGNMGLTFCKSFLKARIVKDEQMLILEKSPEKAVKLRELNVGTVYGEPGPYIQEADLIILAVKPQDVNKLFDTIKGHLSAQQVVLSIMAGIKIETIKAGLQLDKVIRAMPNLPAQIGNGMTVFHATDEVTRIELVMVQNLLNATGKTIYVDNENAIDAATSISGSGPAYVFYLMQAMIDKATELGFSDSESELLTYETFKGAVELVEQYNFRLPDWISRVASRGGTTEAALDVFNTEGLDKSLQVGIEAAYRRAKALSN